MQLAAVIFIVGLAAAYLIRATWRAWAGNKAACASGCGKCAVPTPPEQNGRFPLPQA